MSHERSAPPGTRNLTLCPTRHPRIAAPKGASTEMRSSSGSAFSGNTSDMIHVRRPSRRRMREFIVTTSGGTSSGPTTTARFNSAASVTR
jgi:hypothetical protein